MKTIYTSSFVLLIVSAVLFSACSEKKENNKSEPDTFSVIRPSVVDTIFTKEYIAQIQSLQNVEIRTRVKGFIEKIHVDEGKPVLAGQILFTLGGREFKENLLRANANYKSAIAELKVAEVELKNTKTLAEKNIVSSTELDMAIARKEAIEAKIEEAKSAISIAELNLSYTQVKAPFTGVINRIPFKTGSLVSEGDLLTTISNNQEVFAYFNVSEKEFLDLMKRDSIGVLDEVSLLMANNELFKYAGRIETAENEIDKGTGNIAFRARFKNPKQVLRHGATGKILVREELRKALIIPQKATFEIQDKAYVFVVDSSNKVRMRNIVPGVRLDNLYVVKSGLTENDRVIYEGIQQVEEGENVKTQLLTLRDVKTN
jgi:membrane fusion protein (multidrug efflux system)